MNEASESVAGGPAGLIEISDGAMDASEDFPFDLDDRAFLGDGPNPFERAVSWFVPRELAVIIIILIVGGVILTYSIWG